MNQPSIFFTSRRRRTASSRMPDTSKLHKRLLPTHSPSRSCAIIKIHDEKSTTNLCSDIGDVDTSLGSETGMYLTGDSTKSRRATNKTRFTSTPPLFEADHQRHRVCLSSQRALRLPCTSPPLLTSHQIYHAKAVLHTRTHPLTMRKSSETDTVSKMPFTLSELSFLVTALTCVSSSL